MPRIIQGVYNALTLRSLTPVEHRNIVFLISFTMFSFACWLWLLAGTSSAGLVKLRDGSSSGPPFAVTKNGSYAGVYDVVYNQDYFLGVPYALPPTGERRFKVPRSLNGTWSGTRDAKSYSNECVGYGVRTHFPLFQGFEEWKCMSTYTFTDNCNRAINGPTKSQKIASTSTSSDHRATKTPSFPSPSGFTVAATLKVAVLTNATICPLLCRIL